MTTTQSFKIYEILQRHFNNNDDAKTVVQEIEQIIEAKVDSKKDVLATKQDIYILKEDITVVKEDILKFQIAIEKRFNGLILWIVGTGIATTGLIFTIIKLFITK
jgi:peptidoglycan hydrolase CwlO-like protein